MSFSTLQFFLQFPALSLSLSHTHKHTHYAPRQSLKGEIHPLLSTILFFQRSLQISYLFDVINGSIMVKHYVPLFATQCEINKLELYRIYLIFLHEHRTINPLKLL
ncbi:hypothetical protein KIL84_011430 [Mauremys mutica]|uniref:Secreted protein n=1 Tax=Mauremys mutica TaxID=74926 RepID=A0A9D3XE78_9SAUR|nr:hypothetical protein KIL84_011430 [Mauremys mutica]